MDPLSVVCGFEGDPPKQWASCDALIQSVGDITNIARCHGDANMALGMILEMHIPGQICILNALNKDGYSTGKAPLSDINEPQCYTWMW